MTPVLPSFLLKRLQAWAEGIMVRRPPDFTIGGQVRPYIQRWWTIGKNRLLNLILHRVLRSDDDRALHDHPWPSVSIILQTGYYEILPVEQTPEGRALGPFEARWRGPGAIVVRRAGAAHRLVTKADYETEAFGRRAIAWPPAVTLFITGPKVRSWGFWCQRFEEALQRRVPHFVPWKQFVAADDPGRVGPGCGE